MQPRLIGHDANSPKDEDHESVSTWSISLPGATIDRCRSRLAVRSLNDPSLAGGRRSDDRKGNDSRSDDSIGHQTDRYLQWQIQYQQSVTPTNSPMRGYDEIISHRYACQEIVHLRLLFKRCFRPLGRSIFCLTRNGSGIIAEACLRPDLARFDQPRRRLIHAPVQCSS